jgi:riboflavin synthase
MFTGIITDIGTIERLERRGDLRVRLAGSYPADGLELGASIACDGVCLTVVDRGSRGDGSWFEVDVSAETLARTNIGTGPTAWEPGRTVNLERPLRLGDELGGHIVQGHVDGTGHVIARTPFEHWEVVRIALPATIARYVVEKGSITVDGVSLTVSALGQDLGDDWFEVSLIPTTLGLTTLGGAPVGTPVNLEVDVIAKYVERLMGAPTGGHTQ